MIRRYEALIMAIPEITQEETKNLETEFGRIALKHKGNIISFERWGKYKLPYQVRKNDYAVYFLTRFEFPSEQLSEGLNDVKTLCAVKLHEVVMRHLVHALTMDAPLTYQRPRSLEEVATEQEAEAAREGRDGRSEGRDNRGPRRDMRGSRSGSTGYANSSLDDSDIDDKIAE